MELADRTVKYPKEIAKNVLVGIGKFTFPVDFIILDMPEDIKEGEVIEEFRTRDEDLDTGIDDYPSYCDHDKKIQIDYKMVYKGDNVVGALMNVPTFVRTFYVVTDFVVLEDMDAYRDEGMGNVIVGEPFLREVGIKARRFEGTITLYKGDKSVTYQMVRSHLRFKRHTNEQCNKIYWDS
nr:hypothetical protein [Tanacetum cinerariifolium]